MKHPPFIYYVFLLPILLTGMKYEISNLDIYLILLFIMFNQNSKTCCQSAISTEKQETDDYADGSY